MLEEVFKNKNLSKDPDNYIGVQYECKAKEYYKDFLSALETYLNFSRKDVVPDDKHLQITLNSYSHTCGDGCCHTYGLETTINGTKLENENDDLTSALEQVLNHLGFSVTIEETYESD